MFSICCAVLPARVGRIADDHDLHGIDAARHSAPVQLTALPSLSVIRSLPVAPVTHRSMWLLAPGLPGRAGDVGLIPFDDDGEELARRKQRRDRDRQRGRGGRAGGVEIQQRFARVRSRSWPASGSSAPCSPRTEFASLPAAEKYATPCASTVSIACATMPSWKNGSSK